MNIFNKIQEKVGVDKLLHFLCGFVITSLGFPQGILATINYFALAILIGMLKELIDEITYKGGNFYDWLATALGAATALYWILI